MKAKMTEYKGVYFRSRLEVKWCSFFECLGVGFEYEPQNEQTTLGGYIPDFYFRALKTWVEIKGKQPTDEELTKLKDVCRKTNKCGLLISGYPKAYMNSIEPHLANCACYFISSNGESVRISADEIYQISKDLKILVEINKASFVSSISQFMPMEYLRCKSLEPAQAKFKSKANKGTIKDTRLVFKELNKRLNKK